MAAIAKRGLVSILLLLLGAGLIVAGATLHSREVLAQIEQKAVKPPAGLPGLPGDGMPAWMQQSPSDAQATPQYVATWIRETEPQLVREITVGGLTRGEDGRLQRTYSGDTPSLCPT